MVLLLLFWLPPLVLLLLLTLAAVPVVVVVVVWGSSSSLSGLSAFNNVHNSSAKREQEFLEWENYWKHKVALRCFVEQSENLRHGKCLTNATTSCNMEEQHPIALVIECVRTTQMGEHYDQPFVGARYRMLGTVFCISVLSFFRFCTQRRQKKTWEKNYNRYSFEQNISNRNRWLHWWRKVTWMQPTHSTW